MWEDAAGQSLFEYDNGIGFPINLVYDDRQERVQGMVEAEQAIDRMKADLERLKTAAREAKEQFDLEQSEYEAALQNLNAQVSDYNRRIEEWNRQPSMPDEVAAQYRHEKQGLVDEKARLDLAVERLDRHGHNVNNLVEQANGAAARYNKEVDRFNAAYGRPVLQRIGVCRSIDDVPQAIDVFAFTSKEHLAVILAHELGHALGLKHVSGNGSIMSAVEEGAKDAESLRLTDKDVSELRRAVAERKWAQ